MDLGKMLVKEKEVVVQFSDFDTCKIQEIKRAKFVELKKRSFWMVECVAGRDETKPSFVILTKPVVVQEPTKSAMALIRVKTLSQMNSDKDMDTLIQELKEDEHDIHRI